MRKGSYFFVIDAFVAGIIITGALVVMFSQFTTETTQAPSLYTAEDLLLVAETTIVQNLDDDLVRKWISNGTINETWRTVLGQIAFFNATGRISEAEQLAQIIVDDVPDNVGTRMRVGTAITAEKFAIPEESADVFFTSKRIVLVRSHPGQIYDPVIIEVNTWQ